MRLLAALIGAFMGFWAFGMVAPIADAAGLPSGPGWLVVVVPFMAFTAWLCVRDNKT